MCVCVCVCVKTDGEGKRWKAKRGGGGGCRQASERKKRGRRDATVATIDNINLFRVNTKKEEEEEEEEERRKAAIWRQGFSVLEERNFNKGECTSRYCGSSLKLAAT